MVSTSDIECLVKYTISVHCWHKQRSPPLARELLYMDDSDIVTYSEDEMQRLMNRFVHVFKIFGLEINLKKIVVWHDPVPWLPTWYQVYMLKGQKPDVIPCFVYLHSTLAERCSFDNKKASGSFLSLEKHIWSQHDIKLETNFMVYEGYILTSLLYASETWTLHKHQPKTIERFHRWDKYFVLDCNPISQIQRC